jgi:hypothetical protein
MGRKRHTPEQIIRRLREAEVELAGGPTTPGVAHKLGITEQTYDRWRKEYAGLRLDPAKRLKELEKENARLEGAGGGPGARRRDSRGSRLGKLLSPARRRRVVTHVRERFSQRAVGAAGVAAMVAIALPMPADVFRWTFSGTRGEEVIFHPGAPPIPSPSWSATASDASGTRISGPISWRKQRPVPWFVEGSIALLTAPPTT